MSFQVGIDLGTTYTAAALHRDGSAAIFGLGSRSAAIPSVVLLRDDGTILTGDAAERRAMSEPERVVREFKRRLGDSTPIIVGGAPYSAEALTARMLESVMAEIEKREGGLPSRIMITHPANWGDFKRDLLAQAVQLAGVDTAVVGYITEPEAAALSYAAEARVEPGQVVAVYDLGGGTFDAAVLRRTADGFSILGKPEGIERLGGIDFDAAVFAHVSNSLGDALTELDPEDPAALAAVARLRQDCIDAKEALSSDTDASVNVLLPNLQTEVRITRQEFEALIRPTLVDSIDSMRRAIASADLEVEDVARILLVGGSSRIPLIAQLVSSELGRPVAVDAHPKHTVAVGAALAASGLLLEADSRAVAPPGTPLDPTQTVAAPAGMFAPAPPPPRRSAGADPQRSAAPSSGGDRRPGSLPIAGVESGWSPSKPLPIAGSESSSPRPSTPSPSTPAAPPKSPSPRRPSNPLPIAGSDSARPASNPLPIAGSDRSAPRSPSSRAPSSSSPSPGAPPAKARPIKQPKPVPGVSGPPPGAPPGSPPSSPAAPSSPPPRPPSFRSDPPSAPSKPASPYRSVADESRTEVFPPEKLPSNLGPVAQSPSPPKSRVRWFVLGFVVVALVVLVVLLLTIAS